jgi:hypothetical protein
MQLKKPDDNVPTGAEQAPMQFTFKVYRDCDVWRLRKVVIQIHHPCMAPLPIDRTRMFQGPFFVQRLSRRMRKMAERARVFAMAHAYVAQVAAAK